MTEVFDDEWAARLHQRWHDCDQRGTPQPMTDPMVSAAAGLADTASLFAQRWATADPSGRDFLTDALRDACERALKALGSSRPEDDAPASTGGADG
jgi:hypothetical protein